MNFEIIATKCAIMFGHFGIIVLSYYLPKEMIFIKRKDKLKVANSFDKLIGFSSWFAVSAIAAALITSNEINHKTNMDSTIAWFIIIYLPCMFGLLEGYRKESKLTLKQRNEMKDKLDEPNYFDEK